MTKSWSDKSEYKHLLGELAVTEGRAFERAVLPLLRARWPEAVGAPARRSIDQAGIDALVWSHDAVLPLVVQCKGFQVLEEELGATQIANCLRSIEAFQRSGIPARMYLFVHNRIGASAAFRSALEDALARLRESGQVEQAELWNVQRTLTEAFNSVLQRAIAAMRERRLTATEVHEAFEPELCAPLRAVPLAHSRLVVDQYRLVSASPAEQRLADPAEELLAGDARLSVVIGEAGFGKTTAALRTFAATERQVLYLPGAAISERTIGTKDLIEQCVNLEALLGDCEPADRTVLERIARPILLHILRQPETPAVLVLDGLDESAYLCRRGGIQNLLNLLREVRVPIVLLVRSELWHERREDFATPYGVAAPHAQRRSQQLRLIELLPWTDREIVALAERYRDTLVDDVPRRRVDGFAALVRRGDYAALYGDIPRRPLFLRQILETLTERDVDNVSRATLFREWAQVKIQRDVAAPMQWGSVGRPPLVSSGESSSQVVRAAFRAMMHAAHRMTQERDGTLELLPSCGADEVLEAPHAAGRMEPLGLYLNSLLVPVARTDAAATQELRFAHRAYQEFFLALDLLEHPEHARNARVPDAVREWLTPLEREPPPTT